MTWRERGQCVGQNPLWWDSDWLIKHAEGDTEDARREDAARTARRLCEGCPVLAECRDDAVLKFDISEPFNRCASVFNESGRGEVAGEFVPFERECFVDVAGVVRAGFLL